MIKNINGLYKLDSWVLKQCHTYFLQSHCHLSTHVFLPVRCGMQGFTYVYICLNVRDRSPGIINNVNYLIIFNRSNWCYNNISSGNWSLMDCTGNFFLRQIFKSNFFQRFSFFFRKKFDKATVSLLLTDCQCFLK